jgi:hypothetical protein
MLSVLNVQEHKIKKCSGPRYSHFTYDKDASAKHYRGVSVEHRAYVDEVVNRNFPLSPGKRSEVFLTIAHLTNILTNTRRSQQMFNCYT